MFHFKRLNFLSNIKKNDLIFAKRKHIRKKSICIRFFYYLIMFEYYSDTINYEIKLTAFFDLSLSLTKIAISRL